jgi:parallel beta-helix repeat protein
VFVYDDSSPYYENLIIYKQIYLIGEAKETTIIDGTRSDSVIYIIKDNVSIRGFTVQNGSRDDYRRAGIEFYSCNISIIGNIITNNLIGIHSLFAGAMNHAGKNTFRDNHVIGNDLDAFCIHSSHNIIQHNHIEDNKGGISLFINCVDNTVEENNFINNTNNAAFCYSRFNRWKNNYWDDWIGLTHPLLKLCPKIIIKKIAINQNFTSLPWFNFDWHPAQEPYDIP